MQLCIDRAALSEFIGREVDRVESHPLPRELAAGFDRGGAATPSDELGALWLAAGLATQVGQALIADPMRFVRSTASRPQKRREKRA